MPQGNSDRLAVGEIDQIIKLPMVVDYKTEHHDGSCTFGFFPLAQEEKTTPELWTGKAESTKAGCSELRTDNPNLIASIQVGQVFDFGITPNMELTNKWYERDARKLLESEATRG